MPMIGPRSCAHPIDRIAAGLLPSLKYTRLRLTTMTYGRECWIPVPLPPPIAPNISNIMLRRPQRSSMLAVSRGAEFGVRLRPVAESFLPLLRVLLHFLRELRHRLVDLRWRQFAFAGS